VVKLKNLLNEAPRKPRKKGMKRNSKKHSDLYTDENPKGTIHGLKFVTPAAASKSVSKIRSSGRSHAHKIQAAIAMEQRARAAGKSSAAAVYRKFINQMKKKTKAKNESHHDRKEGKMAKYDAKEIYQDAQDVFKMIDAESDLPEWLEAKITKAADYMNSVKDYLSHHMNESVTMRRRKSNGQYRYTASIDTPVSVNTVDVGLHSDDKSAVKWLNKYLKRRFPNEKLIGKVK